MKKPVIIRSASKLARSPARTLLNWFQDGLMKRLAKNSGWILGGTMIANFIALIGLTVRTRDLGAELLGLYAVILAYVGLMERLTFFKSWVPLIKFGAEAKLRNTPKEIVGYFKLSLITDILGSVAAFALAIASIYLVAQWQDWKEETIAMVALSSITLLFGAIGAPTGLLRIYDRFRLFSYRKVAEALFGLAGTLLAWWMGWGLWGYLITTMITASLGKLWLLMASFTVLREEHLLQYWREAQAPNRQEFVRFGWWSYLSGLMDIPFKQLDLLILSTILPLGSVGIYRIIKQVTSILGLLTDAIYQAVYPQFATLVSAGNFKQGARYCVKIGTLIAVLVAPIALPLAATSYWWMPGVFGVDFRAGWMVMSLLLVLKILTVPTMPIHPLFTAAGFVKTNMWILAFANATYMVLLWALASKFGLFGTVAAWFIHVMIVVSLKSRYLYLHLNRLHQSSPLTR